MSESKNVKVIEAVEPFDDREDFVQPVIVGIDDFFEDTATLRDSILEKTFAATTKEEVFAKPKSLSTRDLVGEVLTVNSIKVRESKMEGKEGIYAVLGCTYGKMEAVVNTSSISIISKLIRLAQLKELPVTVRVVSPGTGRAGGQILDIELA
jgi:hypothetical protein